ncbi:unnamed protein product [Allacma fusca]|uniref:Uncharacterized protein n=1 Tax=Allacma fusca TaxID=39272 RepID=A0A8J2JC99_9HEXA|nr:unnamed protein product [Allacma fusca]
MLPKKIRMMARLGLQQITVSYFYVFGSQVLVLKTWGKLHLFVNNYHEVFAKYKKQQPEKKNSYLKPAIKFIRTFFLMGCASMVINTMDIMKNPRKPIYFTAAVPPSKLKMLKFVLVPIHLDLWLHLYGAMLFATVFEIHYLFNLVEHLKNLHPASGFKSFKTMIRKPEFMKAYRQVMILQAFSNSFAAHLFGIWDIVSILVAISGFYGSLAIDGTVRIKFFYVGCYVTWFVKTVFDKAAEVRETSLKVLSYWKIRSGDKEFRMFLATCRPIGISVSNMFVADRTLVFSILSIILDNTVTLMLTTR